MIDFKEVKHFKLAYILSYAVYFVLVLVVPCIIIATKYNLFVAADKVDKLSGFGLIVVMCFAVVGLGVLKKTINKIPTANINMCRIKAGMNLIFNALAPIIVVVILSLMKSNFETAYTCVRNIAWCYLGAAVYQCVILSGVDREVELRGEACKWDEVEARRKK